MPQLADADATDGTLRYEFDFQVPANPRLGIWTATVTAKEGVEGLVEDVANIVFAVHGTVTLGKTWTAGATAGDTVLLSINGGATVGAGSSVSGGATTAASATSTAAASLTLAESFSVGDGNTYSGALACTRTKDAVALVVSGTGFSRTITMPNDSSVTCTWTNTKVVPLLLVKSVSVVSDPVNLTINPKAIPGAIVEYTILVSNPGSNPIDADSVIVSDPLPTQVALLAGDLGAPGSGPVAFIAGGSGLTFAPADAEYSTDGTNWIGYVPVAGGDGTDPLVKAIRVNPEGVFNGGGAQFTLKFRARVK